MIQKIAAERRTVLLGAAATGLVVGTTAIAGEVEAATPPTRARFTALVGHTFVATRNGVNTRWRLEAVSNAPYRPRGLTTARLAAWRRADFVLAWSTTASPEQGSYTLKNPALGSFRLFVVPGDRAAGRTSLTAIFNRWRG